MTAINFCFDRRQACIVTDSLVSGRDRIGATTKAYALPHLGMVFAGTGPVAFTNSALFRLMSRDTPGVCVDDLDAVIGAMYRDEWKAWARAGASRATIFHFGADRRGLITAIGYASERDFTSERFAPGYAYVFPGIAPIEPTTPPAETSEATPTVPSVEQRSFHDCVGTITRYVERQHREYPAQIGGRVHCCFLTPFSVHQHWLLELDPETFAQPRAVA